MTVKGSESFMVYCHQKSCPSKMMVENTVQVAGSSLSSFPQTITFLDSCGSSLKKDQFLWVKTLHTSWRESHSRKHKVLMSRVGSAISSEELLKILEGNRLNTVLLQLLLPFGLGLSTSGGTPLWCLVGRVSTSLTDATIGGLLKQTEQLNQQAFRMYTRNDLF